mgnify:CR=1 FL=1
MFILLFCILTSSLTDPERLLDRASNHVSEGYDFLVSYQNTVRFTGDHNRLAKLIHKLENLAQELKEISKDVKYY